MPAGPRVSALLEGKCVSVELHTDEWKEIKNIDNEGKGAEEDTHDDKEREAEKTGKGGGSYNDGYVLVCDYTSHTHVCTCIHMYSIYVYHINARMKCKGTVRNRFRVACSKGAKISKLSWIE